MKGPERGSTAVVLGASISGLLAARVLADCYSSVTVVERDVLPEQSVNRRGVPQGALPHPIGFWRIGAAARLEAVRLSAASGPPVAVVAGSIGAVHPGPAGVSSWYTPPDGFTHTLSNVVEISQSG
jgi:hypothetical protein